MLGDTAGLIIRWNLDGVTWGRNTDPDGTIFVSVSQPGAGQIGVALYQDQARMAAPDGMPNAFPHSADGVEIVAFPAPAR